MISREALLSTRDLWTRKALGLIEDVQREERRDVRRVGQPGFVPQRWIDALLAIWLGVGEDWGGQVNEMIHAEDMFFLAASGFELKQLTETSPLFEELTQIATLKAFGIVETSEAEWLAIGEGVWSSDRATLIAGTETVQSMSLVQHRVAEESPNTLYKIWQSIIDDRTRQSHLDANGQRQLLDDPFEVGGAQLQWPADVGGPPGEIINCRCWEDYELAAAPRLP